MNVAEIQTRPEIEKLEQEKLETEKKLERLHVELRSLAEPSADEADVDAYEREKTWALIQRMRQKLESVERALASAQDGSYGTCKGCGLRIEPPAWRSCRKRRSVSSASGNLSGRTKDPIASLKQTAILTSARWRCEPLVKPVVLARACAPHGRSLTGGCPSHSLITL